MIFCWNFSVILWTWGFFLYFLNNFELLRDLLYLLNNFELLGGCLKSVTLILFKINQLLGQASHVIIKIGVLNCQYKKNIIDARCKLTYCGNKSNISASLAETEVSAGTGFPCCKFSFPFLASCIGITASVMAGDDAT